MYEQLKDKDLGEELLIPAATLRSDGDLFLCGMSIDELSAKLNIKITPASGDAMELINAMLGNA